MKLLRPVALCYLVTTLSGSAVAQQPVPAPSTPAPTAQAPKVDPLQRALVDADGHRRSSITAAAEQLRKQDAAGRTRFVETLQAIAALAPKAVAVPAPAAGDRAPAGLETKPAVAKPVEFAEATRQLMASVVMGTPEASKAALATLVADTEAGPAALQRLDERGTAVFEQCLITSIRKKVETNTLFAGQYDELAAFQPLAGSVLLRWAQAAPKEAGAEVQFTGASLRALRDIVPAAQATDALRSTLREIVAKYQKAGQQQNFLTAVCALHQYGDASAFDSIKARFEKQLTDESAEAKVRANNALAELHYQLRDYVQAANYYKALVALSEQQAEPPQDLPTMVYNTACSLALAKQIDEAFVYLEKALKLRQLEKGMIDADHDMNNLRADPRFAKLIEQYLGKANPHGK